MTNPTISFFSEDIEFSPLKPEIDIRWLEEVIRLEKGVLEEISFIFCSDEYLYQYNMRYLQHDTYTDVITFPYSKDKVHGDIFISIERITENAVEVGVSFQEELHRVMVHGVLHLLGYLDKNPKDKKLMTEKEDVYLGLWKTI